MRRIIYRILLALPAILLQVLFYVVLFNIFSEYSSIINAGVTVLSAFVVLFIFNSSMQSNYKIMWLILIIAFPVAGTFLYIFCGYYSASRSIEKKSKDTILVESPLTDEAVYQKTDEGNVRFSQTLKCLSNMTGFPVVYNKETKFYPLVDDAFDDMLEALRGAKKFIFLEFFIIAEGNMFGSISQILKEKVKEGVEVYFLFDDIGSISTYSYSDTKDLREAGVHCHIFNPLIYIRPVLNNRDHRKIMVIDNEVVFSGGFNLADEYINQKERFGHWKDFAVRMTGDVVNSYTKMFVNMWNTITREPIDINTIDFKYENKDYGQGCCFSYYDSPANEVSTSNTFFIDMLYQVKKRAWFYTPYLILNDALRNALISAATRGVDVRIITPAIPDKKIVFRMTQGNYDELLRNGIHIYEYTPGFVHAKESIFDDDIVTVGTVNLDYRSLFLHYENNNIYYQSPIFDDCVRDFEETLTKCEEITEPKNNTAIKRLVNLILNLFAPLC